MKPGDEQSPLILTADLGNRHPHLGLFTAGLLQEVFPLENFDLNSFLQQQQKKGEKVRVFVGQVGENNQTARLLKSLGPSLEKHFTPGKFLDMEVNYSQGLGQDRLFQSYYLYKKFIPYLDAHSEEEILLVDSGTFLTVDSISHQGHLGGPILLGDSLHLQAYSAGELLPDLSRSRRLQKPLVLAQNLSQNTEDAIIDALALQRWSFFQYLFQQRPQLKRVIFTGGRGENLSRMLAPLLATFSLSSQVVPHLIHFSLHLIGLTCSELELEKEAKLKKE